MVHEGARAYVRRAWHVGARGVSVCKFGPNEDTNVICLIRTGHHILTTIVSISSRTSEFLSIRTQCGASDQRVTSPLMPGTRLYYAMFWLHDSVCLVNPYAGGSDVALDKADS